MKPIKIITSFCFSTLLLLAAAIFMPNTSKAQETEKQIFTIVENMPTYRGCEDLDSEKAKQDCTADKIMAYLSENIKYPEEAKSQGVEGRVFISYIVDEDGSINDVQVLRGIPNGKILDEEAVRVVESLPDFNPGMQKGKAVAVRYNLPINFKMSKNSESGE